jgi:hypothetical protein
LIFLFFCLPVHTDYTEDSQHNPDDPVDSSREEEEERKRLKELQDKEYKRLLSPRTLALEESKLRKSMNSTPGSSIKIFSHASRTGNQSINLSRASLASRGSGSATATAIHEGDEDDDGGDGKDETVDNDLWAADGLELLQHSFVSLERGSAHSMQSTLIGVLRSKANIGMCWCVGGVGVLVELVC